ncbi:MAG TPA: hypothetical protein VFI74_05000 [Candidatus Saccharimonadales bacterium]|nr:hypothetical protein [Candidatus Saccharimonadales bacterium]
MEAAEIAPASYLLLNVALDLWSNHPNPRMHVLSFSPTRLELKLQRRTKEKIPENKSWNYFCICSDNLGGSSQIASLFRCGVLEVNFCARPHSTELAASP